MFTASTEPGEVPGDLNLDEADGHSQLPTFDEDARRSCNQRIKQQPSDIGGRSLIWRNRRVLYIC